MKYIWKDSSQYIKLYEKNPDYDAGRKTMFSYISALIKDNKLKSVLDFGCGKNYTLLKELNKEFPNIYKFGYDVAILDSQSNSIVSNQIDENLKVDFVVSTDCLEHVYQDELGQCWDIFKKLDPKIIYLVICTRPAVCILPDGTNAHKTVKSSEWWKNEVEKSLVDYIVEDKTTASDKINNYAFILLTKKPIPNNKFIDRTYSHIPEVGIPEALSILNDPLCHRDDFIGASCYLCYRLLDGVYNDVDFAWEKLNVARTYATNMAEPDPEWFITRWQVSLALVYAYVDVVIRKNPLPREVLMQCITERHVSNHPLQTVNVMRAQLLLAADELFRTVPSNNIHCETIVKKYSERAVILFKLASEKFNVVKDKEANYIYCFSECMECLNEMMKLKYCYDANTFYPLKKIISDLKDLLGDKTKAAYRQTLISMYESKYSKINI